MKGYIIASNRKFPHRIANDPKKLEEILEYRTGFDTIFFPFWSWKVPKKILDKYNCIGFHSAPLPYGRGGSPIQNMIRKGFAETEVTAFKMCEDFDKGVVLFREKISLEGDLEYIIVKIRHIIVNMIKRIANEKIVQDGVNITLPMKFDRIVDNHLPESKNLKGIYDEIRMRDEDGQPKAYVNLGKYKIEFSRASLREGYIQADARIFQE